jgi:hypothetical protein
MSFAVTDAGENVAIDVERLVETRMLVVANSGAGKSWAVRKLLEDTARHIQHIVIDPEGEFSTLREQHDYLLARPQDGDCVAHPKTAKLLAEKVLELGVSTIADIYELKAHERAAFVRTFLNALVNAPKRLWRPVLVVVDEAHVFAPQTGKAESLGAVIDLMTRGRKRGFCGILATQRISKLHKDAAAECNNKLIGRAGLDLDMKRAADELGFSGREEQQTLRNLEAGEFYAFGPALLNDVSRIRVGAVETTHQRAGQGAIEPPPPSKKVREIMASLTELPKEAEAEVTTIEDLRRELAAAKRELTRVQKNNPSLSPDALNAKIERAWDAGFKSGRDKAVTAMEVIASNATTQMLAEFKAKLAEEKGVAPTRTLVKATSDLQLADTVSPTKPASKPIVSDSGELSNSQMKVLNAVRQLEVLGIDQPSKVPVAFFAGYSHKGGGFNNLVGKLRSGGYVDYPQPGVVALTDMGRETATVEDVLTQDELEQRIMTLVPASVGRILKVLMDAYPSEMTKEELAQASGYEPTGGGFNNYVGRLKSLGLADYPQPKHVRASEACFIPGG